MFHTWHAGADCANPAAYIAVRANGEKAWFGWPDSPEVEKEVAAWFAAKDLAEEKAVIARLNKAAMEHVVYVPTGFYYGYQAWRSNVERRRQGPAAVLLGRDEGLSSTAQAGRHARSHRPTHRGDDPSHGDRRPVRVQPALHRAGRSGGRHRRRPGLARGRREDPQGPRPRPAVPRPLRRVVLAASCTATSARRCSPACRSPS